MGSLSLMEIKLIVLIWVIWEINMYKILQMNQIILNVKINIIIAIHVIIDNVYLVKVGSLSLMEIKLIALIWAIWEINMYKILLMKQITLNARINILIVIHVILLIAHLAKMISLLLMEINLVVIIRVICIINIYKTLQFHLTLLNVKINIKIVIHAIIIYAYLAKVILLLLIKIKWIVLKKVIWIIHISKILLIKRTILNARINLIIAKNAMIIFVFHVKLILVLLMKIYWIVLKWVT